MLTPDGLKSFCPNLLDDLGLKAPPPGVNGRTQAPIAAKNALRTDLVFGAVLVTALLTLLLFGVVALLERLIIRWRRPMQTTARW